MSLIRLNRARFHHRPVDVLEILPHGHTDGAYAQHAGAAGDAQSAVPHAFERDAHGP